MTKRATTPTDIATWRKLFTRGTMPASLPERRRILVECAHRPLRTVRALVDLHDLVLFALAHPADGAEHRQALRALQHVADETRRLSATSERNAVALSNTGLAHTNVIVAFSHPLLTWLHTHFPGLVSLHSMDGDLAAAKHWLKGLLPLAQHDAFDLEDFDLEDWIAHAKGRNRPADLAWWLSLTAQLDEPLRSTLFEQLHLYVNVDLEGSGLSATYGRSPKRALHTFPNGLPRAIDLPTYLASPLPGPRRLSDAQRQQLLEAARGILLCGLRETGPVTHVDPKVVELVDMGEGVDIALFHLPPDQRQTFDSYIGYVAFLNTVPAAYGGAWMFPGKTKVGVNVFPALRGGASGLLFAQILRCYAQRYGVDRFEADPYQLGHGNEDGIASGAYWFYYRLGFRPTDKASLRITEHEARRMAKDKAYRCPVNVLRDLVALPMVLPVKDGPAPIEPVDLSRAVLRHVARAHAGDQHAATCAARDRVLRALDITAMHTWTEAERRWGTALCLAVDLVPDLERWPTKEKAQLVALLRAKGASTEAGYITLLKHNSRLWEAWRKAVARLG